MQKTRKLYYEDSYLKTFSATVLDCTSVTGHDGTIYQIILDQTAFYPEGGGQPADRGEISNVIISDVQENEDGNIVHTGDRPLEKGTKVTGIIDWQYRFSLMQHHSGEHIISGLVHKKFGYDNVGFHMGKDAVTIDFNGELLQKDLLEIEKEANSAVYKNISIQVSYPVKKELEQIPYRSKKEITGQIRIVTIQGYDICACCAVHLHTTGSIGTIKITSSQKYKGGTRITLLCGEKALEDYENKSRNIEKISVLLSAKQEDTAEIVEKLKEENNLKKALIAKLQKEILEYKAADALKDHAGNILIFEEDLSMNQLRYYCNLLISRTDKTCILLSGSDSTGYSYIIGSRSEDVLQLNTYLKEHLGAKGGGSAKMVQGSLAVPKDQIKTGLAHYGFI